jgi:hypothetical protein
MKSQYPENVRSESKIKRTGVSDTCGWQTGLSSVNVSHLLNQVKRNVLSAIVVPALAGREPPSLIPEKEPWTLIGKEVEWAP